MIRGIYTRTFNILKTVPIKLWGISLLGSLLSTIVLILGSLPIIIIPLIAAINAGMAAVYYRAFNDKNADTDTLFSVFADFKTFKHAAGGICWKYLWVFLWFLIPVAGPVIAVIKSLSYAFTPYILNEEKSVGAREALKKSMNDTKGCKLNLFAAIIIPYVAYAVVSGILALLALIPFIGVLFAIINFLVTLVFILIAPMFFGLIKAGFYEYFKKPARSASPASASISTPSAAAAEEENIVSSYNVCPVCGYANSEDKKFCTKCGSKL